MRYFCALRAAPVAHRGVRHIKIASQIGKRWPLFKYLQMISIHGHRGSFWPDLFLVVNNIFTYEA